MTVENVLKTELWAGLALHCGKLVITVIYIAGLSGCFSLGSFNQEFLSRFFGLCL